TTGRRALGSLAPNTLSGVHHQFHFRPLLVFTQQVAFRGRSKPALRTQRQVLQRKILGRLVDSLDYVLALFKLRQLGADYPENHDFALGNKPQRLERPGALVVVLQVETIYVQSSEKLLRHGVVAPLGIPVTPGLRLRAASRHALSALMASSSADSGSI